MRGWYPGRVAPARRSAQGCLPSGRAGERALAAARSGPERAGSGLAAAEALEERERWEWAGG